MDERAGKLQVIEICYKSNNAHLGSSLSAYPIIRKIYEKFSDDDVFILSKGHAAPALYAVLESRGLSPEYKIHPDLDRDNGISATTGSLGHGLPIAVGIAMAKKMKGESGLVHVLLGDGECAEGTTFESLLVRNKYDLYNLVVWVDNNKKGALGDTVFPAVKKLRKIFDINVVNTTKEFPHVYHLTEEEYNALCVR